MWTEYETAALLAARQQLRDSGTGRVTYRAIAERYANLTGQPKPTIDATRNRLRRLDDSPIEPHQWRRPLGPDGKTELKGFGKLSTEMKQSVLTGEQGERIVAFDLECTSLKPTVGRILCASFKPLGGETYTFSALAKPFKKPDVFDDGPLAVAIREELEKYDIIVGWNSKEFDVKFLNSRLMRAGERTKRAQYHLDGMWSWRSKASAWSKLDSVQKFLGTGEQKTEIAWEEWMRALGWNTELRATAMGSIIEHCEHDVKVLEEVYRVMVGADVFRSIRRDGGIL